MSEVAAVDRSIESKSIARLSASITLETLLYASVFAIGALLRWSNLGAAPLSAREADQAFAALRNLPMPASGSPLIYSLNQMIFGLFGSSLGDAAPRLGAAVIGSMMILLPILYRDRIGRFGALAASLMLAISPTAVFASRSVDGTIAVVACALAALGFGLRFIRSYRSFDLIGLAISIGLGMAGGAGIVTLLITIGLGALIVFRWIPSNESIEIRSAWQAVRSDQVRRAAWWGGTVFVLVATVALLNPAAIRFVPATFSAWLNSFRTVQSIGAARLFEVIIVYEPLIVVAGLAGLLAVLFRADGTSILLGLWSLGSLMLILLQPGRQMLDVLLALTPLTVLGGMLIQQLIDSFQRSASWWREGAVWLVGAPLTAYLALAAASATNYRPPANSIFGAPSSPIVSFGLTAGFLVLLIGTVFVIAIGVRPVLRAAAGGALAILMLISLSNAWSLNQVRTGDPRELMWGPIATTRDVRDLTAALHAASNRLTGAPNQISINVVALRPDPVIQWYLHDFTRVTTDVTPDLSAQAIVAPTAISSTIPFAGYAGTGFALQSIWNPDSLSANDVLRWWIYREASSPVAFDSRSLWVKINPQ